MFKVNDKQTRTTSMTFLSIVDFEQVNAGWDKSEQRKHHQCNETIHKLGSKSSHLRCYVRKVFLEILQNSQENTCSRVSFLIELQASTCNVIKKETLTQMFFCEFCEIFKNTFFLEHLQGLLYIYVFFT